MLAGGLEIVGLLALLMLACELIDGLLPRRALLNGPPPAGQSSVLDEMQEIVGDVAAPSPDTVANARRGGAL